MNNLVVNTRAVAVERLIYGSFSVQVKPRHEIVCVSLEVVLGQSLHGASGGRVGVLLKDLADIVVVCARLVTMFPVTVTVRAARMVIEDIRSS